MKTTKCALIFFVPILAMSVNGCSSEQEATPEIAAPPPTLSGIPLKGTALDAKDAGFTDCKAEYYNATCQKTDASLFGFKGNAIITFRLENGKMPDDYTLLKFDHFEFDLPDLNSIYPCQETSSPFDCIEESDTALLGRRLLNEGWKLREWRGHWHFYNPKYEAEITLRTTTAVGPETGVSVYYRTRTQVNDSIRFIEEKEAEKRAQENALSSFEKAMKPN